MIRRASGAGALVMGSWLAATGVAAQTFSVDLTANSLDAVTIPAEGHVMLRWETTGEPTKCRAAGSGWSGSKDASHGQERSKVLFEQTTFTIECRKSGVNVSDSVTVGISHRSLEGVVTLLDTLACDLDEGDCLRHELEVACNDLDPRTVNVWEYDALVDPAVGAVVFAVGGEGKGLYGQDDEQRAETLQVLREAGFQAFSVGWTSDTGWQVEGAGLSEPLCGYAQIVRWLHEFLVDEPSVMCAQGNSGGALQIAYGVELYGLGDVLDMIVVTAGPNYSRMDSFCFDPEYPAYGGPGKGGSIDFFNAWETWKFCEDSEGDLWQELMLDKQSLVSDLQPRLLDHPGTRVNSIVSEDDATWERMRVWIDALASETASYFIAGALHGVDRTAEGAAKIQELMLTECFDRATGPGQGASRR